MTVKSWLKYRMQPIVDMVLDRKVRDLAKERVPQDIYFSPSIIRCRQLKASLKPPSSSMRPSWTASLP